MLKLQRDDVLMMRNEDEDIVDVSRIF